MAIQRLGTDANNSLDVAFVWQSVAASAADVRAINQAILDDQNARHPLAQTSGCGGFVKEGVLYVPNRGFLTLFPGDCVALDSTSGQVVLLSAFALSVGPWTMVGATLGTDANNSLDVAVVWPSVAVSQTDVREVNLFIFDDQNARSLYADWTGAGGFVKEGVLYVPNRGALTLFPGDVVAVDSASGAGWPILLTAYGLSAGPWTLT